MKTIDKVREVVELYNRTRQVGHTTTMLAGIDAETTVITHNLQFGNDLKRRLGMPELKVKSTHGMNLRRVNGPVAWDNAALHLFMQEILEELEDAKSN